MIKIPLSEPPEGIDYHPLKEKGLSPHGVPQLANRSKRSQEEIYNTAFHEAAHAVMCIIKRGELDEVIVNEEADADGRLGSCHYFEADKYMDRVWIALAGPAATSIQLGIGLREAYLSGGQYDFDKAYSELGRVLYPRVPAELRDYIGLDARKYLRVHADGWVPEGVHGQMKRKLTAFTKECVKVDEYVCSWVRWEAEQVRHWLSETSGMLDSVKYLADHLFKVRRMKGKEIIELMSPYYAARQAAGKLAA